MALTSTIPYQTAKFDNSFNHLLPVNCRYDDETWFTREAGELP